MHDAMMTWYWICRSQWFKHTPLVRVFCPLHAHAHNSQILLWTNNDLFERKVAHSDIKNFFPDYKGPPGDAETGRQYFKMRFTSISSRCDAETEREYFRMHFTGISSKFGRSIGRNVFIHPSTATDTTMLRDIISNVEEYVSPRPLLRSSTSANSPPHSLFIFPAPSSLQHLRL
jgi:guanine nucleotide-binding protein subunit alpha